MNPSTAVILMFDTSYAIRTGLLTILIPVTLAALVLGSRYHLHMLQLSSYQFQGYFRFLKSHLRLTVCHAAGTLLVLTAILLSTLPGDAKAVAVMLTIAASVMNAVSFMLFWPRPSKKKFVMTSRMWRLVGFLAILCALTVILTAVAWGLQPAGILFSLLFDLAFLPLAVALANLMAQPVEKAVRQWYINDARRMLAEHPGLRIIGITGSYGKTSVKHYLTTMLSERYSVLMTPGSFNTPMGVVRTIREQLRPTHDIFVCEMGARHVGDIKEICDIVNPHDGVLTAIGDQHLETFHTRENIIRTKYELLDAVGETTGSFGAAFDAHPGSLRFVNGDDEILRTHRKYPDEVTYGLSNDNAYSGEILSVGIAGTTFRVTFPESANQEEEGNETAAGSAEFTIPLVGKHNVVNAIGAIAVAHMLGVPMAKLKMAARRLQPAEHRLQIRKTPYGAILDDAYNANPAGAQAALEAMDAIAADSGDTGGRMLRILVTPGMVELGERQEEYNTAFGKQAAKLCDYILPVGKTNSGAIRNGALQAGFAENRILLCTGLTEAMTRMAALEPGKPRVVLLENDLPDDYG
ncbi:MAG: UDP-N-acetylmuramoyl-tripeptide--D-alanyl-D-alanine ligase [Lachnospiraceae bacterium]|nr:UDP-N-acetylmuramoyl-tripeptide--D-alanyl-D-alanine ligase [Lachnospiraceae bacterium]